MPGRCRPGRGRAREQMRARAAERGVKMSQCRRVGIWNTYCAISVNSVYTSTACAGGFFGVSVT